MLSNFINKLKELSFKRLSYLFLLVILIFVLFIITMNFVLEKHNKSVSQQAFEQLQNELEKPYREDTYGGKTPEETIQLFIQALEIGDLELASKYFVLDNQKERLARLEKYKLKEGALHLLIKDLKINFQEVEPIILNTKRYILYDDQNKETGVFTLIKNINNLWKLDAIF